jgi:hypothetical protein
MMKNRMIIHTMKKVLINKRKMMMTTIDLLLEANFQRVEKVYSIAMSS